MAKRIVSATVDEDIARRLDRLAQATNRKRSYYVNAALQDYLEAIEDYDLALERRGGGSVDIAEARKQLGL